MSAPTSIRRRGFSLTELLVVMAILAALATIAVPASSRMMALGRQVVCANNLSQLMRMIISAQQLSRAEGKLPPEETPFMAKHFWPTRIVAEFSGSALEAERLFLCPDSLTGFSTGPPPLMYRSGISKELMPFDPSSFHCCTREGIDEAGEPYIEYCIEENPLVESKWSHMDCCGAAAWSANDGIWRVYNRVDNGLRTVILTYYDCGKPNQLWVNGEFYADNLATKVGMTLKFRDTYTNYGYNALLGEDRVVGPDTFVLMDSYHVHIDPEDPDIIADLNHPDTARHLGRINVLTADAAVRTVSPANLYPDLHPAPWSPAID
jgi:prepilin-type N-terminal cleavage/methylation domain-containing protein